MNKFGGIFDLAGKNNRLEELEALIASKPDFWDKPEESSKVLKEKKRLEADLAEYKNLKSTSEDLATFLDLLKEDHSLEDEAADLSESFSKILEDLEIKILLGEEIDQAGALLTINAGAGGTESCDWASMLMRMYLRYGEQQKWETIIHDIQEGDEAGIKSANIEFIGSYAYGYLKAESGVHRLVRISPFDANAKRHTSFASIFITPVIDDEIEITINPADLRIDTYRASGAGGQHVNRTDSAVRITHGPSGIVVQCQSQRSQHQNKETAMKILKSRLYEREMQSRKDKLKDIEDSKSAINFGSQIRSYVLHPYKMVKDHRTDFESFSPEDILDGDLKGLINAYLKDKKQSIK